MKKYKYLLLILFIFSSCKNDNDDTLNSCNTNNPTEELAWLKEKITALKSSEDDTSKYFFVVKATYYFNTIYVFDNCCPQCNTVINAYNCEGILVGQVNSDIKKSDIIYEKIIYKHDDFDCEF